MKIAFLVGTLGQGGAEKQLFLLATELKKKGEEVLIYSLTKGEFWWKRLEESGIKTIYIGDSLSKIKRLISIYQKVKTFQPHILYSFHFYTSSYAAIVGRLLGVFSIGSIRNDGIHEKKSNGLFAYLHFHLPHGILANSEHGLSNAQSIFLWKRKRIGLLRNAIAVDIKCEAKTRKNNNQKLKILFVGRLIDQKQPMLFLDILLLLKKLKIDFEGRILGEGQMRAQMTTFCRQNNLSKYVLFEGKVSNVFDFMNEANLLLCTSINEGTPNAIMESMAIGLPVISSNFTGIEKLLGKNQERGLIFTNKDMAVAYIKGIHNEQTLQRVKTARKFIEKYHSAESLAFTFLKAINKMKSKSFSGRKFNIIFSVLFFYAYNL